jgi:hypothetical protein
MKEAKAVIDSDRWYEIDPGCGVYSFHVNHPQFISLRMLAIRLKDNSVMVVSPIKGLSQSCIDQLRSLGQVKFLLAPNHFHNLGIRPFVEMFPGVKLVARNEARPRLKKLTGLEVDDLESVQDMLPQHVQIYQPAGTKSGETWIRVATQPGNVWIVSDSFFNMPQVPNNFLGFVLRVCGTAPGLRVSRVFRIIALRDKAAYRNWVAARAAADQPVMVIPGHGEFIRGKDLAAKLVALI